MVYVLCCLACCNVLCLRCRLRSQRLPLAHPCHRCACHLNHHASDRAACAFAASEVCVAVCYQLRLTSQCLVLDAHISRCHHVANDLLGTSKQHGRRLGSMPRCCVHSERHIG